MDKFNNRQKSNKNILFRINRLKFSLKNVSSEDNIYL